MYKITIDNGGVKTVIHSKDVYTKGGQTTEEVNCIPSFKFLIYPDNPGFDKLTGLYTKITCRDLIRAKDIFIGRVLTVSNAMDEQGLICKSVICEGEMGYLCDSVQSATSYSSGTMSSEILQDIISKHNAQVDADKQLTVGSCALVGLPKYIEIDWENTLDVLKTIFVDTDTMNGEIRVRSENGTRYIDFAERFGKKSDTPIKLSKNLKSITQDIDPTALVTRLYPLGGKKSNGKRVTIDMAPAASGKTYIDNTDLINKYGVICGTVIYDDIVGEGIDEAAAAIKLYNTASDYFKTVTKEKIQYQVTALDLSAIDTSFDELELYNRHDVANRLLSINEELRIIGRTLNLEEPQKSALTFGDKFETLTGLTAKKSKETEQIINETSQDIRDSMQTTVDYITGSKGGYVVQKFNSDNQPIATYYTDNLDISKAKEMLIINNRGILGSTDGGETYNTAIDIRGNINASQITTGTLSGITIKSNNAIITGGMIQIETESNNNNAIKLNCGDWTMELSPLQFRLYNSSTDNSILLQAGAAYFKHGDQTNAWISCETGVISATRFQETGAND